MKHRQIRDLAWKNQTNFPKNLWNFAKKLYVICTILENNALLEKDSWCWKTCQNHFNNSHLSSKLKIKKERWKNVQNSWKRLTNQNHKWSASFERSLFKKSVNILATDKQSCICECVLQKPNLVEFCVLQNYNRVIRISWQSLKTCHVKNRCLKNYRQYWETVKACQWIRSIQFLRKCIKQNFAFK